MKHIDIYMRHASRALPPPTVQDANAGNVDAQMRVLEFILQHPHLSMSEHARILGVKNVYVMASRIYAHKHSRTR